MIAIRRLRSLTTILRRRSYSAVKQGSKYSQNYRQYLKLDNGEIGSYFHDIPMELNHLNRTVNMVVEIPRWTHAKFEISKDLPFNPITQDVKKGKVRFVNNIFPFYGYIHNYGAIPQTWEDPTVNHEIGEGRALVGDNDPLDCCEIGSSVFTTGEIKTVKILGSIALIDDGELDWKVIVINVKDPLASSVNNIHDVEKHFPGLLTATRNWFRDYKVPMNKLKNEFAFNGEYKDVTETIKVIEECHNTWKGLISGGLDGSKIGKLPQVQRAGNNVTMSDNEEPESDIPKDLDKWYYVE
ncbi:inorganic diphosphatase PPA2 NDAI_0K00520 [Naumovozyma dairenensis CBS 421]|uniref:inorganic diphosphatase n=1 Tax=Naumovozyma dairenensis (strain ATCC 10597 / BCRC 20456 / CBS 421 / NBRC 0211 / NRRL Y-12639) TaxID=1071378 RepID=G0WHI2_NAUDC|nr:hypothetical protein NDAI_0K00520 [Naumovozyma dairenensis CBS 421]CCD27243.1 hypothetical protein NDAI_0K00520 [Naumovozyma dairenensis CBS 421]